MAKAEGGDGRRADVAATASKITANIEKVILGKRPQITLGLVAYLCEGHILLEDVPGVAKTMLARALARSVGCTFKRIQCTPDLLPTDVTGVSIFNQKSAEFEFRPGPVFAQTLLADEINRTTPKTQSALLEAMNEAQVTVDNHTHPLPQPFFVLATQNPIEHHGTYPLPESQMDRFLMRIRMGYPARQSEKDILRSNSSSAAEDVPPVMETADLVAMQEAVRAVRVDDSLLDYTLEIVERTRQSEQLSLGVSPRGSVMIYRGAQARAFLEGRDYCIPDDFKQLILPVFAHRIVVSSRYISTQKRSGQAESILAEILETTRVPL